MATIAELIEALYIQIGDSDRLSPSITDGEYTAIIKNSAKEYSRIKSYIKIDESQTYNKDDEIYSLPADSYKVKKVELKTTKWQLAFEDNVDQIYLTNLIDVEPDVLKITYSRYFTPEEVIDREVDLLLLYGEALCYKLLATKAAELVKFATGEKIVDESLISEKYLELYKCSEKKFRDKAIKAYGRRADTPKENLDYRLPYPIDGELP